MNQQTIDAINTLGNFCGKRDIEELTSSTLTGKYNIPQADIFVLFGGSIICGGDVLAQAIQNKIAKHYIIVGGAGHTTQTLREKVHTEYPPIVTALSYARMPPCNIECKPGFANMYLIILLLLIMPPIRRNSF